MLSDKLTRAMYATDAGNYRIPPSAVAFPETTEQLRDAVSTAVQNGQAVTMRGAGTSCAGNAIGPELVIDTSRHLSKVLEICPADNWARVQPGTIMAQLQEEAGAYGLRFGPDPSTWTRCTIGGMIGNNACGPHAQAWGRTGDNVLEMQVIDGLGREYTAYSKSSPSPQAQSVKQVAAGDRHSSSPSPQAQSEHSLESDTSAATVKRLDVWRNLDPVPGLETLIRENLSLIRTHFGSFSRQVSGYAMEALLPENGCNLAAFLVGSEGTLAAVLEAKVRLVPVAKSAVLVAAGYPDMIAAARPIPAINKLKPLAVEGMDARLVDVVRAVKGPGAVPDLPAGGGWLLIEVAGEDEEHALANAREVANACATDAVAIYPPGADAAALWRIRADGAGLGGRTPVHTGVDGEITGGEQAWPGWEDAAVPPENLADYLQDFTELIAKHQVDGLLYGHFGDGCVHVRLDLPLGSHASVPKARAFLEEAAACVAKHGGSLSGEHGDGRARSELLPHMYPPEVIALFAQVKELFDPLNRMNPGVLTAPGGTQDIGAIDRVDDYLRRPAARPQSQRERGLAFPHDHGDLTNAVHRCTGVGKCRAGGRIKGSGMCPSYQVTREEKDATRGRARALQEVANGALISSYSDPELLEALDMCLACKACSTDCPAGINMALYKSESLDRAYEGRWRYWRRPRSHWLLGRLPAWLKLMRAIPFAAPLANLALSISPLRRTVFAIFGLDGRRQMARFDTGGQVFGKWAARRGLSADKRAAAALQTGGIKTSELGEKECAPPGAPSAKQSSTRRTNHPLSLPTDQHTVTDRVPAHTSATKKYVVLWADSFSRDVNGAGARATARVLQDAGYTVVVPPPACCGLTWVTSGQLPAARKRMTELCGVLAPFAAAGIPIVGVEPSCSATLHEDLPLMLPADPRARMISAGVYTLAQLLLAPSPLGPGTDWKLPDLHGRDFVAQPHCHQRAVFGWDADRQLLAKAGAKVTELTVCCGMGGNFGMEKGHYDMSVAVAELELLPALRAHPDATLLTDGFSCRTQSEQLAGRHGVHLAQLLAGEA